MAGRGNRRKFDISKASKPFFEMTKRVERFKKKKANRDKLVPEPIKEQIDNLEISSSQKARIISVVASCIDCDGYFLSDELLIIACEHPSLFEFQVIRKLIKEAAFERQYAEDVRLDVEESEVNIRPILLEEAFCYYLMFELVVNSFGKKKGFFKDIKKGDIQEALACDICYGAGTFKTEYSKWLKSDVGHFEELWFIVGYESELEDRDYEAVIQEYVSGLLETAKESYPTLYSLLDQEK